MERADGPGQRHPGCRAGFLDDGSNQAEMPACVGGMALIGCSNPWECVPKVDAKRPADGLTYLPILNRQGVVHTVVSAPKGTIKTFEEYYEDY